MAFNDVAQCNTRFGIVTTELMKATEDTRVGNRLATLSPGGRLGYDRCLVHQDILVGGEDLEPRFGCEREWRPITCPGRVVSTRLVVVVMSATLAIAEGILLAIFSFWVWGTLGTWGESRMLRWG
ncbi:unnamed protein product [Prunus armeniaca]